MVYDIRRIVVAGIEKADILIENPDLTMADRAYELAATLEPLYNLYCTSSIFAAKPFTAELARDIRIAKSLIYISDDTKKEMAAERTFLSLKDNFYKFRDTWRDGENADPHRVSEEQTPPSDSASMAIKSSFLPTPFNLTPVGQFETRLTDSELGPSAFVKKIGDLLGQGLVFGVDVTFYRAVITSKVKRGPGKGRFITRTRNLTRR